MRPPSDTMLLARARCANGNQRVTNKRAGRISAGFRQATGGADNDQSDQTADKSRESGEHRPKQDVRDQHSSRAEPIGKPAGRKLSDGIGEKERGEDIADPVFIQAKLLLKARGLNNRAHADAIKVQDEGVGRGDAEHRITNACRGAHAGYHRRCSRRKRRKLPEKMPSISSAL